MTRGIGRKAASGRKCPTIRAMEKLEAQRQEFARLQANACTQVSKDEWMNAVRKIVGKSKKPERWLAAAEQATTRCDRCSGTGIYSWGACTNGKMQFSGECFRCKGKGSQGQEDYRRNAYYDAHRKITIA